MSSDVTIVRCDATRFDDWAALREQLWPAVAGPDHLRELHDIVARGGLALVAYKNDSPIGFAEATLRHDHVNGCDTSPVAFLEGLFVVPQWRRRGVARALCAAVERWATDLGCAEFGSDTLLEMTDSQRMHEALGFEETERVVYYRKRLR